jgi:hypothetical protein
MVARPIDPDAPPRQRRWRHGDAIDAQNQRPGRPTGGRRTADQYQPAPAPEDPAELISETRFRTQVCRPPMRLSRWQQLLADSQPAWQRGEDGPLIQPDDEQDNTTAGRTVYRWRADRAVSWWNQQLPAARIS